MAFDRVKSGLIDDFLNGSPDTSVISLLRLRDTDVNAVTIFNETPLHMTPYPKNQDLKLMLLFGADTHDIRSSRTGLNVFDTLSVASQTIAAECLEEIKKMKIMILNDGFTVYDFLFMESDQAIRYVVHDMFSSKLMNPIHEKFSHYGDVLCEKRRKAADNFYCVF